MNSKQIIELAESIAQDSINNKFIHNYKIVNAKTNEVLAESRYFDYLKILQIELIKLHEGFMDTKDIIIRSELIKEVRK